MLLTIWLWYGAWWIIQKSEKCIFEWSKEPKMRFLAIFLSLVCWIDLMMHIRIVLNVIQLLERLPGHEGSFKNLKNGFLNDPKSQKWGFLDLGLFDRLDIVYYDRSNCVPKFDSATRSSRIIQKSQNAFLNDPKCQKRGCWSFSWFWSVESTMILHIVILLNVFQHWLSLHPWEWHIEK